MKTVNARHDLSFIKAKQEVSVLHSKTLTNQQKLAEGFVGNNYFITITSVSPEYKAIKLFIKANNKAHARLRVIEFPDAYYFLQENPDAVIAVSGSCLQQLFRAEGLCYEQTKG
jgi:hypothetical protein